MSLRLALVPSLIFVGLAAVGPVAARERAGAAPPAAKALAGLDAFVTARMLDWKAPGVALAVVKDGRVLLARGYGYRDVEKKLPVTARTLFAIGSITKSFTVATLGTLVDEGKLAWDTPVREYLPAFRLQDEVAGARMTPRDLVTHRSGLPRHDALWYGSEASQAEMVARLRYLEPSRDFRALYQYNNLMFMTAGHLASRLGGRSYQELVRERLFAPLAMARSNFSVTDSQRSDDFAVPYQKVKDEVKAIPFRNLDEIAPAGSINSCAEDMARYLLMYLGKGKLDGESVLSESSVEQMTTPQMVAPSNLQYPELGHVSYGMGLSVGSYRGHTLVGHGGAIDGFLAQMSLLPREGIGVVVLTNLDQGRRLPFVLSYDVLDRLLGLPPAPWDARFKDEDAKLEQSEEEAKQKGFTRRREGTQPSHELAEYAGEFEHPGYGVLRVERQGDALELTYNRMSSPLRHFHYDAFEVPENPLDPFEKTKLSFFTSVDGEIGSVAVPLEPAVAAIVFTRRPEARLRERGFLETLAGQYELGPNVVTIALRGENTLVLSLPGQPERELIPRRGTSFDLEGLTGFSVEFKLDASGAVSEAAFYQPDATYLAKRRR